MRFFGWFRRAESTKDLSVKGSLPWAQMTILLTKDVAEFLTETAKRVGTPRSNIINIAVRRLRRDLEDGIRSQEVEVPKRIIHDLKHSEVMRRFFEENVQLAINYKPEPEQGQDQQQEVE